MNSGAPAAHGRSGELCKRPLWQDMNPLAWRETDHSSGQFLAEQTVFGPFHGKYLLLSQGYVPLLTVTRRTETTSPSATSPTLRSHRPSETAGGPTAPSGPRSRPLAPLQPSWDRSRGRGSQRRAGARARRDNHGDSGPAGELAQSRVKGDGDTGVPGWCTHLYLVQSPRSVGHRAGHLDGGEGLRGAPGASKPSFLLPLHGLYAAKGQGPSTLPGAPQTWHSPCWFEGRVLPRHQESRPRTGRWGAGGQGVGPASQENRSLCAFQKEERECASSKGCCQRTIWMRH